MKIPLSERLRTCAGFVKPGDRVADIGCDHGYLSIYLLKNGIAASVIASDINEGPLQSALVNARKFGVAEGIAFYLSDGVRNIPRDFDCLVCAGMGGDTMIHILEAAPWLKDPRYRLVLQCQSKTPMLRKYLSEQGWYINREAVLRDGRFLYTVMEVIRKPGEAVTVGQWYYPRAILEAPSPEAPAYFRWVKQGLVTMVTNRGDAVDPEVRMALEELEKLESDPRYGWLKEEHL